jgi:hypothetical protein
VHHRARDGALQLAEEEHRVALDRIRVGLGHESGQ